MFWKLLTGMAVLILAFTVGVLVGAQGGLTSKEWAISEGLVEDVGVNDPRWGDLVSLEDVVDLLWKYDGNAFPTTTTTTAPETTTTTTAPETTTTTTATETTTTTTPETTTTTTTPETTTTTTAPETTTTTTPETTTTTTPETTVTMPSSVSNFQVSAVLDLRPGWVEHGSWYVEWSFDHQGTPPTIEVRQGGRSRDGGRIRWFHDFWDITTDIANRKKINLPHIPDGVDRYYTVIDSQYYTSAVAEIRLTVPGQYQITKQAVLLTPN